MSEDKVETREQAIQRALDWAEGRLSHINTYMTMESGPDQRIHTLAACEAADAQEVVKWTVLAAVLPPREVRS